MKNKQTVCCEKVKDLETLRQLAEAKDTWHVNFYDIRISFFFHVTFVFVISSWVNKPALVLCLKICK